MIAATAYELIVGRLRNQGKKVRQLSTYTTAQCPSHDDRQASLAIYSKPGKARVMCFAGCSDVLDILPALGMNLGDLYDDPHASRTAHKPDPEIQARLEARRNMTPSQRAIDDLLHRTDIGERLCLAIARICPELYIWEREQLGGEQP